MMNDFPPTAQDIAVKEELTAAIQLQLENYEKLMSDEVMAFNKAFKALALDYLVSE